ncbi:unnamed protein product [Euphydryas editha]|uniref:Uncharacterized protein n=1 Tax=Euphydryas editha TaxID=104508 RepID=A0AAU9V5I4_EUPED|nr:unnamed protein product [Euphydryas editha]
MNCEIKGKVVAVTGSADGIGLAMVMSFLEQGAKLAILLDINENKDMWEESPLEEFSAHMSSYDCQDAPAVGDGTVEIFKKAESGSVWLVEGSRPAEKIDI